MSDPALKYRDRVDPQHEIAMQAIGLARMMLADYREHFERFRQARRNMNDFGGLLDPTLYRDMLQSKSFAQQERLIAAAVAFLAATDDVVAEAKSAGGA